MKSNFLLVVTGTALISVAVLAVGCNNDTLNGGSQGLNVNYTPSPSGSGRFEVANYDIVTLQVLPADPAEAALYGPERIVLTRDAFPVNLTAATPVLLTNIALSAGTYNVTLIEFSPPTLNDETPLEAPPSEENCLDGVSTFDAQAGDPPDLSNFLFRSSSDDLSGLTFTVQPGQTSLSLTLDVPALIDAYQQSFKSGCQLCTNCAADPRSTVTTFNTSSFRTALLATISIN